MLNSNVMVSVVMRLSLWLFAFFKNKYHKSNVGACRSRNAQMHHAVGETLYYAPVLHRIFDNRQLTL